MIRGAFTLAFCLYFVATFVTADAAEPAHPSEARINSPLVEKAVTALCAPGSPNSQCLGKQCQPIIGESMVECSAEVPYPKHGTDAQLNQAFAKLAACAAHHTMGQIVEKGLYDHARCAAVASLASPDRNRTEVLENMIHNIPIIICKETNLTNACFSGAFENCKHAFAPLATICAEHISSRLPKVVSLSIEKSAMSPFAECTLRTYLPGVPTAPCGETVKFSIGQIQRNQARNK